MAPPWKLDGQLEREGGDSCRAPSRRHGAAGRSPLRGRAAASWQPRLQFLSPQTQGYGQALDHVRKPILPGGVGALDQIGSKAQYAPDVGVNDGFATAASIPGRAAQRFEGQQPAELGPGASATMPRPLMRSPGRIGGPVAEELNAKGRSMRSRQARRSAVTDKESVYAAGGATLPRSTGRLLRHKLRAAASADDAPGGGEAPLAGPSGWRRPCSQFCKVSTLMPSMMAERAWPHAPGRPREMQPYHLFVVYLG